MNFIYEIIEDLQTKSIASKIIESNTVTNDYVIKLKFHNQEEYIQITPYNNGKLFSVSWAVDKRTALSYLKYYKYLEFDHWQLEKIPPKEFVRSDPPKKYHYMTSVSSFLKKEQYLKIVKKNDYWHIVLKRTRRLNSKEIIRSIHNFYNLRVFAQQHPEEISSVKHYNEGGRTKVVVNKYERDPKAREMCIKQFGYYCIICGFEFSKIYGEIGQQYIHVHHLKMISSSKKEHKMNPIKDLRPVCPNCHSMLHQKEPPYTIEEMKNIIRVNKIKLKRITKKNA